MAKMTKKWEAQIARDQSITVTVFHVPSLWLPSMEQVIEVPVHCMVSYNNQSLHIDLATPLVRLPDDLAWPGSRKQTVELRVAFRKALRLALAQQQGREVGVVKDDRVIWDACRSVEDR